MVAVENCIGLLKPALWLFRVERQQFDQNVQSRSAEGSRARSSVVVSKGLPMFAVEN